mmetsp:Transcript_6196/g.12211  ORF Transcript_6196/g.12211 Transcript_6196/m.12211 type:complete len:383 (-) Transcript_6196:5769-6917(-)
MPMLEWHKSANWLIIYEWLSSLISPAVAVYRGTRPRVSANASASIGIRDYLGWNLPSERSCQPGDVTIWIHAASVGEASSAIKALQSVRERGLQYKPRLRAVLSAGNASGLSYLKDWSHGQYVECVLLPVDSPQTARLFLDWARPQCGVFVEGDLWPALMAEARRRMIPLALIEARISDRSWRRWNSIPPGRAMASNIYRSLTRVACGDPSQGEQLQWLGAPAPMILPTIKFARIRTPRSGSVTQRPRKQELLRSLVQGKIPWLAASIHAGEEDLVLKSHVVIIKELRARSKPEPLLIVAPRHPLRLLERILSSCEELQLDSTAVATWTELCERPPENPSVISVLIVDTLGNGTCRFLPRIRTSHVAALIQERWICSTLLPP